jgi:uncharacterized protein DUF6946
MNKIYLPTVGPQDWQKLLADPEKEWRTGYSARTMVVLQKSEKNAMGVQSHVPVQLR